MILNRKIIILSVLIVMFSLTCKDPWEDHIKLNDSVVTDDIIEVMSSMPEISVFFNYFSESGLDSILSGTKNYTIWAPVNEAFDNVNEDMLTNSTELNKIIKNHIAYNKYSYINPVDMEKIKTYAGKNLEVDFVNGTIEDAVLYESFEKDIPAKNGVIHVINKVLLPKKNIWEYIESTDLCPLHTGYLNSLTGTVFDPDIATILGVDPETGQTIYDTTSGMVWQNDFIDSIRDLKNEDTLSMVILVEDPVFQSEFNKFEDFFDVVLDTLGLEGRVNWNICKDYVFKEVLTIDEIYDTIVSVDDVKVPFNKSAVVESYEASNGIIYVLSECALRLQDKFKPIIIEGEDTLRILPETVNVRTGFVREKELASGGLDFLLADHGKDIANIKYPLKEIWKGSYKVYMKAVNDYTSDSVKQKVGWCTLSEIGGIKDFTEVNYIKIDGEEVLFKIIDSTYTTAQERYIGDFVGESLIAQYRKNLWIHVEGEAKSTPIMFDYIKLVLQFE